MKEIKTPNILMMNVTLFMSTIFLIIFSQLICDNVFKNISDIFYLHAIISIGMFSLFWVFVGFSYPSRWIGYGISLAFWALLINFLQSVSRSIEGYDDDYYQFNFPSCCKLFSCNEMWRICWYEIYFLDDSAHDIIYELLNELFWGEFNPPEGICYKSEDAL